ncbi:MAG: DNA-directed RNA polymerase subunit beta [Clostridiaceae bacterium]|jgi:DNA-directed RNA polymerase subunit beta|nr:DNA-directed RNA polymerase subunit beta [Clostridiaceae bacterium]
MPERIRKVKYGTTERVTFSQIKDIIEIPYLIKVQKDSYKSFIGSGIGEVFKDYSPIVDYSGRLELSFLGYSLHGNSKYTVKECKDRDATYAVPLKVMTRLTCKDPDGNVTSHIDQDVFMGDFPLMTDSGSFVINGAERVIVSQLVRSPGVYCDEQLDKNGIPRYKTTVIPNRGAWLEFEQDSNDLHWVHVDRTRKITSTTLLRALGLGSDEEIIEKFGGDEMMKATCDKDTNGVKSEELGKIDLFKRLRPGEVPTTEGAEILLNNTLFEERRYDLARVGRYKYNKKLSIGTRITGHVAATDIVSPITGEILVSKGEVISEETAKVVQNNAVNEVFLKRDERYGGGTFKTIGNYTVDLDAFIDVEPRSIGVLEKVYYPTLKEILDTYESLEDRITAVKARVSELVYNRITRDDIYATVSYNLGLRYGFGTTDDIDHLSNRRVRAVGELLQNQFRIGVSRLERVIKERMAVVQENAEITPQSLINIRPVTSAVKEFFGSSQLSQFMDQPNPIAELTHKRKLSALGRGGLNRERAGFEVRDVHHSHYGRMCPIETPEGQNIGLISSISTYALVNEYGFIESPYRKINKETGVVTEEVVYMTADEEDKFIVAQANEPLDEEGHFKNARVNCRFRNEIKEYGYDQVDYMDVSPKQLVSIATSLIPFLENDDTNRALMGSNMQRQAVPLLRPEAPIIATGTEHKVAYDSGVMIIAREAGTVKFTDSTKIVVANELGEEDVYLLSKFQRSNQSTCINQRVIVSRGDCVDKGAVLADGPATKEGELALGRNILIGFMSWEGYNYEDAILISEDLVKNDVFTSIHIEEYEIEARDTKLGEEQITRDIPNLSEEALKNLDEEGIIMVGAEVHSGDILVGKVTPKGETELTPEERLLRAIFGEKAREVRDTSLRVPHGEGGIIVDVKTFTRKNRDELSPGVNKLVRVYIAQKRKISVGDKMAGRHGNKGVISRVLPKEDMPFMADGTPLQIVLNPLGVPSRMNIGQVLEVHLGMVANMLGWKVATPVFDGANEQDIKKLFIDNGLPDDGKIQLFDGRTGEPFENRVTVGYMYMLKLAHLVDDKIHARSTGPYSLVTQQPLGGKAQFGGQRFGEMEVWALEAYGAANILQEILTVKSDDVVGRVKTYESIVKGNNISEPGVPEAFKVLIKELQSIALDVKVLTEDHDEINIRDFIYDEIDFESTAIKKEEELREIDVLGDNLFGGMGDSSGSAGGLFDMPDDDPDGGDSGLFGGSLFDDDGDDF